MADSLAMARSFYSWVVRLSLNEGMADKLPRTYPTSPRLLKEVTENLYEKLKETEHEARAGYWKRLFSDFHGDDESMGVFLLDEGFFTDALDVLVKIFNPRQPPPPALPNDSEIERDFTRTLRGLVDKWKQTREEGWIYRILNHFVSEELTEEEEDIVRKIEQDKPRLRDTNVSATFKYKVALWSRGMVALSPLFTMGSWLKTVSAPFEYGETILRLVLKVVFYFFKKAFGVPALVRAVRAAV